VNLTNCEHLCHLLRRLEAVETASATSATDLFLAHACANGDPAALRYLEREFLSRLPRALSRLDPSPGFTDEVIQILRLKLLLPGDSGPPRILEYGGRGPLRGWLRVAALRIGLNLRGPVCREQCLDSAIERDLVEGSGDPEHALIRHQLRAHLKVAFVEALSSLSLEERNLLRMHLVEGLSIDRLAVMFQIHRSTAARRVRRLRELLHERMRSLLAEMAGLAHDELDSALRHVRSVLEVSASSWLS
jgi:RNA polymerase sigma-70 factor (ECF subfamily)